MRTDPDYSLCITSTRPDAQAPCPACFAPSTYVRSFDRFLHNDGSGNKACWVRIVRGEAHAEQRAFDEWHLPAAAEGGPA